MNTLQYNHKINLIKKSNPIVNLSQIAEIKLQLVDLTMIKFLTLELHK